MVPRPRPPALSVVFPCYNEADRLQVAFQLVRENLMLGWEWIFVDDGSTDQTRLLIERFRQEAPDQIALVGLDGNRGKGGAVCAGIRQASGRLVGFIDADLAVSPLEFGHFLDDEEIGVGRTILIGVRLNSEDQPVERYLYRHLMGRVFQMLVRLLTGLAVYDSQCGFKLLATGPAKRVAEQMSCEGFAFDVEFLMWCNAHGLVIREVPVRWTEQGNSKVRPIHIFQMFCSILSMRRRLGRCRGQADV